MNAEELNVLHVASSKGFAARSKARARAEAIARASNTILALLAEAEASALTMATDAGKAWDAYIKGVAAHAAFREKAYLEASAERAKAASANRARIRAEKRKASK